MILYYTYSQDVFNSFTGFLFEYVSCANYLGEIIEWFGYALACWNIAGLSFVVFTVCNLIPRAMQHHR